MTLANSGDLGVVIVSVTYVSSAYQEFVTSFTVSTSPLLIDLSPSGGDCLHVQDVVTVGGCPEPLGDIVLACDSGSASPGTVLGTLQASTGIYSSSVWVVGINKVAFWNKVTHFAGGLSSVVELWSAAFVNSSTVRPRRATRITSLAGAGWGTNETTRIVGPIMGPALMWITYERGGTSDNEIVMQLLEYTL